MIFNIYAAHPFRAKKKNLTFNANFLFSHNKNLQILYSYFTIYYLEVFTKIFTHPINKKCRYNYNLLNFQFLTYMVPVLKVLIKIFFFPQIFFYLSSQFYLLKILKFLIIKKSILIYSDILSFLLQLYKNSKFNNYFFTIHFFYYLFT